MKIVDRIKSWELGYWSMFLLLYVALDVVWLVVWAVVLVFFNPDRVFYTILQPTVDLMCALFLQMLLSVGPTLLYPRVHNWKWLMVFPTLLLVFLIIGMVSADGSIWRICLVLVGMPIINMAHVVYDSTWQLIPGGSIRTYVFCFLEVLLYYLVTFAAAKLAKGKEDR